MAHRTDTCGSGPQNSLKNSIGWKFLATLFFILAFTIDSGFCKARPPCEMGPEPTSTFSLDEETNTETEENQQHMIPEEPELKMALLYQLMKQYLLEEKNHNFIIEGDEKIKRNNIKKKGPLLKGGDGAPIGRRNY